MSDSNQSSINEAIEALRKCMISADRAELNRLTAEQLIYGHTSGRYETKPQFIEGIVSGKSRFSSIKLTEQIVNFVDNVAVVHHIFQGIRTNPPPGHDTNRIKVLSVWIERQGQWQVVGRQAVKIPD